MKRLVLLVACALLDSCGLASKFTLSKPAIFTPKRHPSPSNDPFAVADPSIRVSGSPQPGATTTPMGSTGSASGAIPNPMFDFSSAFSGGGMTSRIVNWRRSGSEAAVEARRAGVPLLIFFSNHTTPTSALLESMLNNAPEAAAIGQHFIPLYIDFADKETRDSLYYRGLLDRYKPRGYPVLLAALPDGTEVIRQSGYAGEAKLEPDWRKRTLQFITVAATQSDKAAAARRKRMEQQGYRTWTNNQGKPVFAKLDTLDANQATFTGEWGESFRTFTNRLSESDRRAIEEHNPPNRD